LSRIGLLVDETGPRVLAWTLMDNHVHLLLTWGHPILFLSRRKSKKNKIFKNNELKTRPFFTNTPASESAPGLPLDFDESLAHNEL